MTEKAESGVNQEGVRPEAASLINSKNHEPGRELDALVMSQVFGREIKWHNGEPSYVTPDSGDGWVSQTTVPRFSTSLFDAWRVVDRVRALWVVEIRADRQNFTCRVGLWTRAGDTVPHAICLAALRAIDV